MKFDLIDDVLEQSDERIVVIKQVSRAEEYLADHFPSYPVLPGVLMIETMTHAARRLLARHTNEPLVLGEVKAMKFGMMVRPGRALEVEVTLGKVLTEGCFACRGVVSGRFTMRPVRR
jgi:3-hydroxyacyl-[acyl-carrier-protein] dehydratase